jgi:iron complex outermembrane receptor protein
VIDKYANLAVAAGPNLGDTFSDNATGQVDWNIGSERLSYVGSWQRYVADPQLSEGDPTNAIPGYEVQGSKFPNRDTIDTHELRIASVERVLGLFDYVAGIFHERDSTSVKGDNGLAAFLPGAFGPPGTIPSPVAPNTRYQLDTIIDSPRTNRETSFFGNLTTYLGDKWEVSAGGRHIWSRVDSTTAITTTPAYTALALPAAACAAAHGQFGATYPGICDVPVPARNAITPVNYDPRATPWIYEASVSYHITPDLMAYAQTASSWRQGPITIGISNATGSPVLNSLINHTPEKSKSYEVGLKYSFLDHRGRLNVDYFHQTFDGLIYSTPYAVYYLAYSGAPNPTVSTYPNFVSNVPASIDGIDIDFAAEVTRHWTVGGNLSWADTRLSNASVPCNDGNFDGVPDTIVPTIAAFQAAGKLISLCKSSAAASTAPRWNANLQSEYVLPAGGFADAFLRGLFNYQPSNPNLNQGYVVPSYGLLNLYAGLRGRRQQWELTLFAKNITGTDKVVTQGSSFVLAPGGLAAIFGPSGYTQVSYTPRRQYGVSIRYAFGSD